MALEGAERIDEFLNEAKVFFLATVDGDNKVLRKSRL